MPESFEPSGFAKLLIGPLALAAIALTMPSRGLALGWLAVVLGIIIAGDWFTGYSARRQVAAWCNENGFSAPRWKRRGGFVSWGVSIWSFCELLSCEFDDSTNTTYDALVDVCGSTFGLKVKAVVLSSPNKTFDPNDFGG